MEIGFSLFLVFVLGTGAGFFFAVALISGGYVFYRTYKVEIFRWLNYQLEVINNERQV